MIPTAEDIKVGDKVAWETIEEDGILAFVGEVTGIKGDYVDVLLDDGTSDFRMKENVWKIGSTKTADRPSVKEFRRIGCRR